MFNFNNQTILLIHIIIKKIIILHIYILYPHNTPNFRKILFVYFSYKVCIQRCMHTKTIKKFNKEHPALSLS